MLHKDRPYRIIISGGGTGGHIYPAIAIAKALQDLKPETEVLFVGAQGRMEMEKVPAAGYKIVGLPISGIQRRLTLKNLKFPFKVIMSLFKSGKIIKDFNPDAAVGVGGYASFPLLFTANGKNVPTVIQEQNGYAGVANKFLSKRAERIFVAYNGMDKFFPANKLVLTGNPVRKDILDISAKREQALNHFKFSGSKKILLVIGGSLGARTINKAVDIGLEKLAEADIQVIWQTGKLYAEQAQKRAAGFKNVRSEAFIYDMDLAYAAADLVISRAGALSISELCLVGKPALLVPSPNVAEDHQTKNAMALVEADAAKLVPDDQAASVLINEALALFENQEKQKEYSENIKKLGRPDAARQIAEEIFTIIRNRN